MFKEKMGQLFGPDPIVEIVITQFEDDKVNFQIEGMRGQVAPEHAIQLLWQVQQAITQQVQSQHQEAPK